MITEEMVKEIIERTYPELPFWIGTPEGDVIFIGYNPGVLVCKQRIAFVIKGLRYELNEDEEKISKEVENLTKMETLGCLSIAGEDDFENVIKHDGVSQQFYFDGEREYYFINKLNPKADKDEYSELVNFLLSLKDRKNEEMLPVKCLIGIGSEEFFVAESELVVLKGTLREIKLRMKDIIKNIAFENPEQFALVKKVIGTDFL